MRTGRRLLAVASVAFAASAAAGPAHAEDDPFGPSRRPAPGVPAAPPARAADDLVPDVLAFRPWLLQEDWLSRALAAKELTHRSDDGTVRLLAQTLEGEGDPRVLCLLLRSLAGRSREDLLVEGGVALAQRLVSLLGHPQQQVRARALQALAPIPPVRLGEDPARYRAWWAKGREGLALEAGLAAERRAALRPGAARGTHLAPGETKTVGPAGLDRFRDLERIHRQGLDVVVCLDSTGSMGEVIAAAKAHVLDLVRRLRALAPKVRFGLVTYDDGAEVRLALTPDETAIASVLGKVEAEGGGDEEEGVDKAVLLAIRGDNRVAWSQKALRVVLVVGDAPPHEEDVGGFLRALEKRRDSPDFEAPVRVDTVSTAGPADAEADGLVRHFAEIARAGHGAAVRLAATRDLVTELLLACFGPAWREPMRELLAEVEAFEREGAPPPRPAR